MSVIGAMQPKELKNVRFIKNLMAEYESDLVHGDKDFWVMYEFDPESRVAADVWDCDVDKVELITRLMDQDYRIDFYINRCDMVNDPALREKIGKCMYFDWRSDCWIYKGMDFEPVYHPYLKLKEDAITFTIRYLYDFQKADLEWLLMERAIETGKWVVDA